MAFLQHQFENIGEFELHFMLVVPLDMLSVDIKTGASSLNDSTATYINNIVYNVYEQHFKDNHNATSGPLSHLDRFLEKVKSEVISDLHNNSKIEVMSLSISLFADIYENHLSNFNSFNL